MTEEELVIFDMLTRPAPALSTQERAEVKKVARELLNRLKQLLVLNWPQKTAVRAQLRLAIDDILDTGLPRRLAHSGLGGACAQPPASRSEPNWHRTH